MLKSKILTKREFYTNSALEIIKSLLVISILITLIISSMMTFFLLYKLGYEGLALLLYRLFILNLFIVAILMIVSMIVILIKNITLRNAR
jgi:hypothetical protein